MVNNRDIDIQLEAGLDLSTSEKQLIADIKLLQQRLQAAGLLKIKMTAEMDEKLVQAVKQMSANGEIAKAGANIGNVLATNLINAFNIKDKGAQKQIRDSAKQLQAIYTDEMNTGKENPAFLNTLNQLGEVVEKNANILKSRTGIYDDFFQYFQSLSKIKIPDIVRKDLGNDWNTMRMASANKFVVNKDGIELDSIYQEMSSKYKDLFSGTTDQTEQFREIVNAIRAYRADIDTLEPVDTAKITGFSDDMWDVILAGIGKMRTEIQAQLPQITADVDKTAANIKNSLLNINASFGTGDLEQLTADVKAYFSNLTGLTDKDIKLKFVKDANEDIQAFTVSLNKGQGILEDYKFTLNEMGEFTYRGGTVKDTSGKEFAEVTAKAAELQNRLESLKSSYSGFLSGTFQTNPFKAIVESIDFTNITDKSDLQDMINLLRQAESQAKALDASIYKQWSNNSSTKMNQNLKEMGGQLDILEAKFKGANFQIPDSVTQTFGEMRENLSTIHGIEDPTQKIAAYNRLQEQMKQLTTQYTLLSKESKNYTDSEKLLFGKQKLGSDIVKWMVDNKNAGHEFDAELVQIIQSMQGINKNSDLSVLRKEFDAIKSKAEATKKATSGLFTNLKETMAGALTNMLKYQASYEIINRTREAIKGMISDVEELQGAMVEFNKVADLSQSQLERFTTNAYVTGTEIARSGRDIVDGMSEFKRAGYELNEVLDMSKAANMTVNIGDGINSVSDAASSLIAILRGYDMDSSQIMEIVDLLNQISNTSPIGFADLTEGLERTSGTLAQTGTSIEETTGLLTAGFARLRNIEKVSTGLVTISQRLRGVSEDGEAIEGLSASMQDAFGSIGVEIEDANGNLRSTFDIINDYAKVFPTLTSKQKQYFGELAASKRQITVWNSLVSGIGDANKAIDQAAHSMGSAAKENEIYMNSIAGAKNAYQNAMDQFAKEAIDDQWISDFIASGTALLNTMTNIISTDNVVRDTIGDVIGIIRTLAETLEDLSNNKFIAGFAQAFIMFKALDMTTEIVTMASGAKDATAMFKGLLDTVKGYGAAGETAKDIMTGTATAAGTMTKNLAANKKGILGCVTALGKFAMAHPGITAVSIALGVGFKAWNDYAHRVEIAKAKLDDSKSEFNEVFLELQDINEELQKNIDRMDELNAKDKLTYVEQSELEKLQAATKELERQANIQNKETEDAATKLSKDNQRAFELEYGDNNFSSSDVMELANGISSSVTLAYGGLEELAAAYIRVKQVQDDVYQPHDEDWISDLDSASEMEAELESQLIGHLTTLQEYKDNLVSITDFRDLTDGEQAFLANIENGIKMIYELTDPTAWNNIEVNAIFNTEGIEKTKSELVAMAKEGTLTPEMIEGYTNLNKALEDSELILQDGQTAAEALKNEMYALAEAEKALEDSKPEEIVPFEAKSMQDTVSQLNSMSEKWQKVNDLYAEFKDNGTGDFSTESLASVSEAFSDVDGVNIERFLSVLADSSSTADDVQSAFNQLANEYIYASGCLEGLTDATAEQVIKELEAQGVANASAVIHQYLAAQKEYVARTGEDLANATTAEIVAFLDEANASDATKQALAQLELAKLAVNGAQINTASDIEQIISLANAAGASAETMYKLAAVQAAVGGAALIDPTSDAYDPYAAKEAQRSLAALESGKFDFKYEKLDAGEFQSATYAGNKATSNSSSGTEKATEAVKEEFDWIKRRDEYLKRQHEQLTAIADDETASYNERISAIQDMVEVDKKRAASAGDSAEYYRDQWLKVMDDLSSEWVNKIMFGEINIEELEAQTDEEKAFIEQLQNAIEIYDLLQDAEQNKRDIQEETNEHLREELKLEEDIIKAKQEQIQSEMDILDAKLDYIEASGSVATEGIYKEQLRLSEELSESYEDQIQNLRDQMELVDEDSAEYYSLRAAIADCEAEIIDCKTQQEELNETIARLPVECLQKYIQELRNLKSDLQNFIDEQNSINIPTNVEQFQKLIDISQEEIDTLIKQQEKLKDLLGEYKYGSEKFNEVSSEIQDIDDEISSLIQSMNEWNQSILNIPINKLQSVNEELERYSSIISSVKDDYDSTINAVTDAIDSQIESIEKLKEETEDAYEPQIKNLEETLSLLEKTTGQRERELAVEQAKANLAKAQQQLTTAAIVDGKRVYLADPDAVRDAKQEVENTEFEKLKGDIQDNIELLEEERDKILEGHDEEIDRLTDISNKWKEIQENASKYADTLKADTTLGSNWQDKILSGNDDDIYQMFKNLYESTNQSIVQTDEQIASNERIAEMMQVFVDRFIDGSISYESALQNVSDLYSKLDSGYSALEELSTFMNMDNLKSLVDIQTSAQEQISENVELLNGYLTIANQNQTLIDNYTSTWEEMSTMIDEQLEALKKAAEALEEWVKNQKYHKGSSYDSDSDGGGNWSGGVESTGIIESGMNGGNYSESHWDAGQSPYSDDDDDIYHRGIEKGEIGKADRTRTEFLRQIATQDMEPDERYIRAQVGEVVLNDEQQAQLAKNFETLSLANLVPVFSMPELGVGLNTTANDINIQFGDLNLPDVRDVDGFARALTAQFPNIMRQELSKWN